MSRGRTNPGPAPTATVGAEFGAEGTGAGDEGDRLGRAGAPHPDIREQHAAQPAAAA